MSENSNDKTKGRDYTERLIRLEVNKFKDLLQPVNPYRWNIRRLATGKVLDVGCGIGRNLRYLKRLDSVGVDHNRDSVQYVRELGYEAHQVDEFFEKYEGKNPIFDTLLVSHVLEHLSETEAREILQSYLGFIKPLGKAVLICPQENGYSSDSTHKTYFTAETLSKLARDLNLVVLQKKSFPLPRIFGKLFIYNEHIVVAEIPSVTTVR